MTQAKNKVTVADPIFNKGRITFETIEHPELKAFERAANKVIGGHETEFSKIMREFTKTLPRGTLANLEKKGIDLKNLHQPEVMKAALADASHSDVKTLMNGYVDGLKELNAAAFAKHGDEIKHCKASAKKIGREIRQAKSEFLKDEKHPIEEIGGYTTKNADDVKQAVSNVHREAARKTTKPRKPAKEKAEGGEKSKGGKAAEGEIKPGKPRYANGEIHFDGGHHPEMAGAKKELAAAESKLHKAVGKNRKLNAALAGIKKEHGAPHYKRAMDALMGDAEALAHKDLKHDAVDALRKAHEEHVSDHFSAFNTAREKLDSVHNELRDARAKAIGDDLTKIPGYTEKNKEKVKEAVNALRQDVKEGKWLGYVRTGQFGKAAKQNFGTAGRGIRSGAMMAVGALAVGHALQGQKKGDDGQPLERSWAVRVGEGALGLGLIGGGLFRGHR